MFKKNNGHSKDVPLYGVIDERTKSVVYRGDAYTARFMLFAVLFDVVIRGLELNDPITKSNWDLMLIVILGGLISTVYQIKNRVIFNRPYCRSFLFIILLLAFGAIIASLVMYFFSKR